MSNNILDIQRSTSNHRPYPHQIDAIDKAAEYYLEFNTGKLIMPCGSGKTLTAIWIAERLNAKRIIVVIPTLQLQSQAYSTWVEHFRSGTYNNENLLIIGSDSEIGSELGIVPTTEEDKILSTIRNVQSPILVLTTYRSSGILVEMAQQNNIQFDLCIFDEAHHTAGNDKVSFQAIIQAKKFRISKKLFMTATPKVLQGKGNDGSMEMFSMDDEEIYGKEFYRLTTREAIDKGIICDYKIVTMDTMDNQVVDRFLKNSILKDKDNADIEGETKMISIAVAILKTVIKLNLHHIIAFTSTIERSKQFEKLLIALAKEMEIEINIFQIDNNHNDKERKKILTSYCGSKHAIIINARILGEGLDLPAVDAVSFIDEKSSVTDIVQAAGRAWRRAPNKKFGYILLPLLTNEVSKIISDELSAFRRVLSALATTDELVYDFFRNNKFSIQERIKFIYDSKPSESFDINKIVESLRPSVWANLRQFDKNKHQLASIESAIEFVQSLVPFGVTNIKRWHEYFLNPELFPGAPARPTNIPKSLRYSYQGYSAYLFFGGKANNQQYASAEEAAKFTISLAEFGVENPSQWKIYCQNNFRFPGAPPKPSNIPANLVQQYKSEYKIDRFFTNGNTHLRQEYLSWKEAAEFTNSLSKYGVKTHKQWCEYCDNPDAFPGAPIKPKNIPRILRRKYRGDYKANLFFVDSIEWNKEFVSPEVAAKFTKSLSKFGIKKQKDWLIFCKFPERFPLAPIKPDNIPMYLEHHYKDVFTHEMFFTDGHGFISEYVTYDKAKAFSLSIAEFGITKVSRWIEYCRNHQLFPGAPIKPRNIPSSPWKIYRGQYKANEFFSDSKYFKATVWASSEEAINFTMGLSVFGVKNENTWIKYCRDNTRFPGAPNRPDNIPATLREVYKKDYKNELFFSNGRTANSNRVKRIQWASAEEARRFTISLGVFGVVNNRKWKLYCKDHKIFPGAPPKPLNIPKSLYRIYEHEYTPVSFFTTGQKIE